MRDYPSVPNVFRVASSHSINSESTYAPTALLAGAGTAGGVLGGAGANSNLPPRSVQQQQQQRLQQQQHQNGLISGQKQSLANPAASATVITTTTTATAGHAEQPKLTQQQQQLHYGNIIMHHNQPYKLTTTASIERNYQNGACRDPQQQQLQHSPYATLPRAISAIGNGDLHQQKQKHQQQQQQQQQNSQYNTRNGNCSGGRSVAGVINTISGSIPSTGFSNGRATSVGSDLNASLNNSCLDLNKANGLPKLQQQQQQQQKPKRGSSSADYRIARKEVANVSDYPKKPNPCTKIERNNGGYLWILTPVAASISVAIVIAALAGPQWLFTEEKLPNANYNGTANFNALDDGAFITKYTKSSLWILCTTLQGVETYNCIKIDYFPQEGYQPDPHDSTPAIPYTVTKSCPFFLASGIFLLISFIVFLIPTCSHQNNLYYFSAGIMFIVSGLLMLIGLIAYISILKAEIGSKLRSRSTLQPALFKVNYGQSFFLFVFGFIATEFVGLLNIFLYISLQQVGYYSRLPCFTISSIHEKIREGENPRSHTYKSYKHATATTTTTAAATDRKPMQRSRHSNNQHQVHNVRLPPEMELDGKKQLTGMPGYACRKHPNAAMGSSVFLNNDLERRFYFEKPSLPKCNLHSKNLAKSLNELYTEPAPPVAPPPPSAIKAGVTQTLPRSLPQTGQFADLPQEFPMTRSVSTTTDIFANGGNDGGCGNSRSTTPHVERKNRRNMATNTRPTETTPAMHDHERKSDATRRRQAQEAEDVLYDDEPQRLCGLKRGIRKTKDEMFLEFCKRAGVRPKPKNIYYIANEEEALRRRRNGGFDSCNEANKGEEEHELQDDDDDDEEEGFKQLNEEQLYVLEDNPQLLSNPMRNLRRASMYVEPTHLRKLNSNLSLHTLYPPEKLYQKSLFDLERCESTADMWPPYPEPYYTKGVYGGSQNRLHQDYNSQIYQSRTLPRSFMKRNADSQDSLGSTSLHNAYGPSQSRLTNLMLQHQQQLQQQNRFLSQSREADIYHTGMGGLHKSCEDVTSNYQQQQQLTANAAYAPVHRPSLQPIINPNVLQQPAVQWPAAIPSSPSNFQGKYQIYAPAPNIPPLQLPNHPMVTRSASGGGPPKFQRAYAFDEQRRPSAVIADTFDLDEIERERRRSHASLFSGVGAMSVGGGGSIVGGNAEHYDLINGTAV